MSYLLSTAARSLALPAAFSGPWAAVLVPALLYVATRREVLVSVHREEWDDGARPAENLTPFQASMRKAGVAAPAHRGPVSVLQVPGLANPLPGAPIPRKVDFVARSGPPDRAVHGSLAGLRAPFCRAL